MANLTAIKEKIKNLTDYSPQLQIYNDQLDELINDAYLSIWSMRRWNFAFKNYFFKFYPDILPTRDTENAGGAASVTASVNKGSRSVTFSAFMDRLVPQVFEGQVIEIQSYEYTISKVVTAQNILLSVPFHGTTSNSDTTWAIKKRYYDLPQDCLELLSLSHRDVPSSNNGTGRLPPYGKMIALMPRKEEELNLRQDYKASYAEGFVWSASQAIPSGEKLSIDVAQKVGTSGLPRLTYLEVCWAFEKDGKLGPLSKPETVYFDDIELGASAQFTVNFITHDDQVIQADAFQSFDRQPSQWEGMRKVIFWNANFNRTTGERLGLPCWKNFNKAAATRNTTDYLDIIIAQDTDASVTVSLFASIDAGNTRYIEYDGQHLRIRPYPRVDAWDEKVTQQAATGSYSKVNADLLREAVGRYYFKPKLLTLETDSPEMPYEFHQLISYKVLETLYEKLGMGAQSEMYRRRQEKEIKGLEKRYLDHIDSMVVRAPFKLGAAGSFPYYDYSSLRRLS